LSYGQETCGVWRGNVEFEDTGDLALPPESGAVSAYIETIAPGPIHLFFGCRGPQDYLFEDKLNEYLQANILSTLEVAMSRVSTHDPCRVPSQDRKNNGNNGKVGEYVTDKLRKRGKDLCELICRRNACVYICGDGNHMAKDVHKVFVELLTKYGSSRSGETRSAASHDEEGDSSSENRLSWEEAEDYIKDMKLRKRYLLDIWA
jgi:sulfite reductase (NADPH) flavoprotein alpha-component